MSRRRTRHRLAAVSAICGIVCLAGSGPALGADTFDGTYTGTRVLTKGSDQVCPASEAVSTTIHGEALTFTDGDHRNFAIGFSPHAMLTYADATVRRPCGRDQPPGDPFQRYPPFGGTICG
jgi:hypothetical protein